MIHRAGHGIALSDGLDDCRRTEDDVAHRKDSRPGSTQRLAHRDWE